jgi:hypothetical protein
MAMRPRTDCEGFHRRDFLKIGAAGLLGLGLPDLLRLEARASERAREGRKAEAVILVWLAGGPATIDMWDLKPDAPDTIRGPFKQIATRADGVQISEHLPKMAAVADKVTIVRSAYHTIPSHAPATLFMTTGNKPTPALQYPSMGSLATRLLEAEEGVPPYVVFNELRGGMAGGAGFLGTAYNPFVVEGGGRGKAASNLRVRGLSLPDGFTLDELQDRESLARGFDRSFREADKRADLIDGLDAFHEKALEILRSDKTRRAFDLKEEPESLRERYGLTPFGQGALAARRLVESGVRFVTLSLGGWDTHQQNFDRLAKRNLPELDTTLSALISDLDDRGLLDRTIVYCAGEFGRTPKVNKTAGRDHWARSMSVVLAGGGFHRGLAFGSTDDSGTAPATDPCTPDDLAATIFDRLGLDPHAELQTSTGRPIALFREGKVVGDLLA